MQLVKAGKAKVRVYYGDMKFDGTSLKYSGYAQIVKADIKADKAVVQVINRVLIPALPTA
jgi:nicotinamide riboside kinase